MRRKSDLKKLLNLNFIDLTNCDYNCGKYDLPYMRVPNLINPDYLALYSETFNYNKTSHTCVCFYQYDNKFDNKNGLFEAIYFKDNKLLEKYKTRFKNVRYAVSPDYSQIGDINRIENIYRIFKSRIVSLWLTLECNIIVIPNITYANENYFDVMLDGISDTEVVAFSVKGNLFDIEESKLLEKAIRYSVDNLLHLKKIIVYSVSVDNDRVLEIFNYARLKKIEVVIPNNILKERNALLKKERHNGKNS